MRYSKQVTLGYDKYGNRVRKRIYADSKIELTVKEADLIRGFDSAPSRVTFGEYAREWLDIYKDSRELSTKEMYEVALRKTKPIADMKLQTIKQADLQKLINKHKAHPYACHKLNLLLTQVFQRARKDGLVRDDPSEDLELPPKEEKEERVLTEEEKKAIKTADLTKEERFYVEMLYYCGLRPQEVFALMVSDFDFKKNLVRIRKAVSYDKGQPFIKTTKTRKQRSVPVPTAFVPKVKSFIKDIKAQNSLYLMHLNGELYSKSQRTALWYEIKKKINVALGGNDNLDLTNSLHPYTFRHTFCVSCYYMRISVKKTAELMGNSPQVVLKTYTHLDNSREPLDDLAKMIL